MIGKFLLSFMAVLVCGNDVMLIDPDSNKEDIFSGGECSACKNNYTSATLSVGKSMCSIGVSVKLCMNSSYCGYFCIFNSCEKVKCETIGCVSEWHGKFCDRLCSNGCINKTCDRGGQCKCKPNFYGKTCGNNCSSSCGEDTGNREFPRTCSDASGECLRGCKNGWYGPRCENKCHGCNGNTCKRKHGKCLSGCINGYYGQKCDKSCSVGCKGNECNHTTGVCSAGCSDTFHGTHCNLSCSRECVRSLCKEEPPGNISCSLGCKDGYWGSYCDHRCGQNCLRCHNTTGKCDSCTNTSYGYNCSQTCSYGCVGQDCDMTGFCRRGCVHGWMGETCQFSVLWFLLPACVAAVSLIICVTTLLCKRKISAFWSEGDYNREIADVEFIGMRAHCTSDSTVEVCTLPPVNSVRQHIDRPVEGALEVMPLLPSVMDINQSSALHKVALDDFERYVYMLKETGEMITQFRSLPVTPLHPCEYGGSDKFIRMNRYDNILPYDCNRVVLDGHGADTSSDYINASYINGYAESSTFIATQGPISDVITSFWRMLWQKDVNIIVMLTKCVEQNMAKCEQYWPNMGQAQMITPDVVVECLSEDVEDDITTRTFNITKEGHETRNIKQFHFTAWPDRDVPANVTSLLSLHTAVTTSSTTLTGPVVVHCSAGVGRTGTYIALDYLIQQAKHEGVVNVFECVLRLRHQRMNLVQTEVQYVLIHDVLLRAIGSMNNKDRTTGPSVNLTVETGESTV